MHRSALLPPLAAIVASTFFGNAARAQDTPEAPDVVLDGSVVDDGTAFVLLPFDVPAGVRELEIRHAPVDERDILDWGLEDPDGVFRGYGGGNLEPAVVGELAASRSYKPGPLPAGTWHVVVGKAKLVSSSPAYHVEVVLRAEPTLGPATDRRAWAEPAPLSTEARFYAGDFHVHSEDSGDARPALSEIASFARGRGLDFVMLSEHNTDSHVDRLLAAQEAANADAAQTPLLLLPGVEFTTYAGHMNGIGVTRYVDHKLGLTTTIAQAGDAIHAQDALVSINHPALDLGNACIGCAWTNELPAQVDAVEIGNGGYREAGFIFNDGAFAFWDRLLDDGQRTAPLGGSDDHRAGVDLQAFGSPIGDPTTKVFATSLSMSAIVEGVRCNRTVVQLQGPDDPMIDLQTDPARDCDTVDVAGESVTLSATITGGSGARARFVVDGNPAVPDDSVAIDTDSFLLTRTFARADIAGGPRVRVEVLVDDAVRVVTGHVWLHTVEPPAGCTCADAGTAHDELAVGALAGLLWHVRRRRRATPRDARPAHTERP